MKTLIISDLHLVAKDFDKAKYSFLENLFKSVDKIIINGDFWSHYANDFEDFLASDWNRLFPLLISKNTVYIYGNHDRDLWCDDRVNLFSTEQKLRYDINLEGLSLRIEHGHDLFRRQSSVSPISVRYKRKYDIDNSIYKLQTWFVHKYSLSAFKKLAAPLNAQLKRQHKKRLKRQKPQMLIVGHTHNAELDSDRYFANSGFVGGGYAQYLLIENGRLQLVETTY